VTESNGGDNVVTVVESDNGPYAQFVTAGHHVLGADKPNCSAAMIPASRTLQRSSKIITEIDPPARAAET
jgi:hypothetical protein